MSYRHLNARAAYLVCVALLSIAPGGPALAGPAPGAMRLALRDDFTPGRRGAAWEALSGRWQQTTQGAFAPADRPERAYAFAGDPTWSDYILKADLVGGRYAGLCVRARDWKDCVLLVIRPAHGDLWWFVRRGGQWGGVLSPMALPPDLPAVIPVKVAVFGDTYTCYVNGKQVSQIRDATFRRGRVGLYLRGADVPQAWDNVRVLLPATRNAQRAIARRQ